MVHVLPLQVNCTNCQYYIDKTVGIGSHRWEDGSNAHRLAVGRGNSADEGESDRTVLGHLDRYREATTMCPIMNRECRNLWLDAAIYQVRWYVDLDTVFLRMDLVLRIASSDQDATVGKENGFTVIHTGCIPTTISMKDIEVQKRY